MTLDPVEHRGFEYQTGASFTLFARGVRGELGRGGRYDVPGRAGEGEFSTGFTLYMDSVLRALPRRSPRAKVFLPAGCDPERARALRAEGWVTLSDLAPAADARAEARRLGCTHVLVDERLVSLED